MSTKLPRWHWNEPIEPLREVLAAGGVLAIPTESSYGLAADPRSLEGVESIYRIKGRERGKALPVVVADVAQAVALGVAADSPELELPASLWPAPLTAVLPLQAPLAAAADGLTLAVRVPAHRALRRLLSDLGFGLTATSANRSGEAPVLDPADLDALFTGIPDPQTQTIIVDGGLLPGGPPSTLIAWQKHGQKHEMIVLRQGALPAAELTEAGRDPSTGPKRSYSIPV